MSGSGTQGWAELGVELGAQELERWVPSIRTPVAITGATGFVGSHVAEALLSAGLRPRVLARDPARLIPGLRAACDVVTGSLDDQASLAALVAGAGVVLHLAGLVRAARERDFDATNRGGTENMLAALAAAAPAARLVYVSSLAAHGPSPEPGGREPEAPAAPVSAYGRSKLAGEAAVRRSAAPWTILRPPAIYGPRDVDVLQFFRLAARGVVPIPAGERWVSVAHVTDVVRAVLAAAAGEADGRILALGEPQPRMMRELVELLARAGGVRARVVEVPAALLRVAGRCGDLLQRLGFTAVAMTSDKAAELVARHWSARSAPALAALGLPGFVPFAVGAAETWAWYRQAGWLPRATIAAA